MQGLGIEDNGRILICLKTIEALSPVCREQLRRNSHSVCMHCGLSHQTEKDQQTRKPIWNLILEVRGDETFAEVCPVESRSDDLFPYHHFILSNHHRPTGSPVVIRFCVRCGLSHLWSRRHWH